MPDTLSDFFSVLNALGWSALPVWARVISVAYGLALVTRGNFTVARDFCRAIASGTRMSARMGTALVAWCRQPSRTARLEQRMNTVIGLLSSCNPAEQPIPERKLILPGGGSGTAPPRQASAHPLDANCARSEYR